MDDDGGGDSGSDDEHDDDPGEHQRKDADELAAGSQQPEESPDLEEEDEEEDDDDEEQEGSLETVTIEISGLSLYTHHGVSAAEREVGQRLVLDLRLEVGECDATVTDRVEDTVDYGEVCQLVALIAQQRSHRTLERLCSSIADRLLGDYELEGVWVKASKPEPPIPLAVEEVSVEVWREAGE
ncbi:MAG TPA: dihydroneopterin aldolase [Solirubrobacteraceae bacterium]|nr:dihydroneopterin aldolase [Solirubrobacteraceae bacterium]